MSYRIVNERTGETIAASAWEAHWPWTRMLGLLGRSGLARDRAIIFRHASSIHTVFMRFSLDVIYLDRDGKVIQTVRSLKPFQFSAAKGAHVVIEMQAGCLPEDVIVGDRLSMIGD